MFSLSFNTIKMCWTPSALYILVLKLNNFFSIFLGVHTLYMSVKSYSSGALTTARAMSRHIAEQCGKYAHSEVNGPSALRRTDRRSTSRSRKEANLA